MQQFRKLYSAMQPIVFVVILTEDLHRRQLS